MRNAYALLGLSFIIVFGGAYILFNQSAEAPTTETPTTETNISNNDIAMSLSLTLTSSAFGDGEFIPSVYTCDGDNISPPLNIDGVPDGTGSLVLVMDDPDIPQEVKDARGIDKFDHWVVYNIPADISLIEERALVGTTGLNGRGDSDYTGPCPPPEYEPTTHRYIFRLYAIPGQLNFIKAPTLEEVEEAAKGSALESATLTGRYSRVTETTP